MNLVLISPHFPPNFYNFAISARNAGLNVLAIGDAPYEALQHDLRDALTEYYRVDHMGDYEGMLRACAYLTFRYGKIDRLESHNEHWIETDARLRTDFNIHGLTLEDIALIRRKSKMKQVFERAGVEVAAGRIVTTLAAAHEFVTEVGYPVIAKPNIGVGAAGAYKLHDDAELEQFFIDKPPEDYLMEAFIEGELHSFDGLTDQDGRLVFQTAHFYKPGILEVVNEDRDVFACSYRDIPPGLEAAGIRAVKAFNVRERFFHIEFFKRASDGAWVAVEMNIRPPGGPMLDVFNYANDIDLYQQWANVLAFNTFTVAYTRPYHCAFVGIKRYLHHVHSHAEVMRNHGDLIVHNEPIPPAFARAMGNHAYIVRSPDLAELQHVIDYILALREHKAES